MNLVFAHPAALWWLLLAVPLALGYLWPARRPALLTGQQDLWDEALACQRQPSAKARRGLSLAVQVVVLVLLVVALAEPQEEPATRRDAPIAAPAGGPRLVGLAARRLPADPRRCQVWLAAEMPAAGPARRPEAAEVAWNGRPIARAPVDDSPEGRWQQVFEFVPPGAGRLSARIETPGTGATDAGLVVGLPAAEPLRVLLVTPGNPPLEKALSALPLVVLTVSPTVPPRPPTGAVVVLDRPADGRLPAGPLLVFAPQASSAYWKLGEPLERPALTLRGDAPARVAQFDLANLAFAEARALDCPAAGATGWFARAGTGQIVGCHLADDGRRMVVLAAPLEGSDLVARSDFPVWLGETLRWLAGRPAAAEQFAPIVASAPPVSPGRNASDENISLPRRPLWRLPAGALVAILVGQWWFYQRRWLT